MAVKTILIKISADASSAFSVFSAVAKSGGVSLEKFQHRLSNAAKSLSVLSNQLGSFAIAGSIGFAKLTQAGAKFEQAMSGVRAAMDTLRDGTAEASANFTRLRAEALRLGKTTTFTATQAAEGMRFLALAGFDAEQTIASIESVLRLAEAGMLRLGRAAEIVANNVNAFKLEAVDAARVADVLAATAANADTTIDGLGESFKFAAPVAAALGQSIEDTATALGVLANAGLKNTISGTALAQILGKLAKEAGKADGILRQYGKRFEDVDPQMVSIIDIVKQFNEANVSAGDVLRLFEARAGRAFLSLMKQGSEAFDTLSDKINNSFGEAVEQAIERMDNWLGMWRILQSVLETTFINIFESYKDSLKEVTARITGLIQKVNSWVQANNETVKSVAVLSAKILGAAGLGAALSLVAAALLNIINLGITLSAAFVKFGAVTGTAAGPTAALAVILTALTNNFESLKEILSEVMEASRKASQLFLELFGPALEAAVEAATFALKQILDGIVFVLEGLNKLKRDMEEVTVFGMDLGVVLTNLTIILGALTGALVIVGGALTKLKAIWATTTFIPLIFGAGITIATGKIILLAAAIVAIIGVIANFVGGTRELNAIQKQNIKVTDDLIEKFEAFNNTSLDHIIKNMAKVREMVGILEKSAEDLTPAEGAKFGELIKTLFDPKNVLKFNEAFRETRAIQENYLNKNITRVQELVNKYETLLIQANAVGDAETANKALSELSRWQRQLQILQESLTTLKNTPVELNTTDLATGLAQIEQETLTSVKREAQLLLSFDPNDPLVQKRLSELVDKARKTLQKEDFEAIFPVERFGAGLEESVFGRIDAIKEEAKLAGVEINEALQFKIEVTGGLAEMQKQIKIIDDNASEVERIVERIRVNDLNEFEQLTDEFQQQLNILNKQMDALRELDKQNLKVVVNNQKVVDLMLKANEERLRLIDVELAGGVTAERRVVLEAERKTILAKIKANEEELVRLGKEKTALETQDTANAKKRFELAWEEAKLIDQKEKAEKDFRQDRIKHVEELRAEQLESEGKFIEAARIRAEHILKEEKKLNRDLGGLNRARRKEAEELAKKEGERLVKEAEKKEKEFLKKKRDFLRQARVDSLEADNKLVAAQRIKNQMILEDERMKMNELKLSLAERAQAEQDLQRKLGANLEEARKREQELNEERRKSNDILKGAIDAVSKRVVTLQDLIKLNAALLRIEDIRARFEERQNLRKIQQTKDLIRQTQRFKELQEKLIGQRDAAFIRGDQDEVARLQKKIDLNAALLNVTRQQAEAAGGAAGVDVRGIGGVGGVAQPIQQQGNELFAFIASVETRFTEMTENIVDMMRELPGRIAQAFAMGIAENLDAFMAAQTAIMDLISPVPLGGEENENDFPEVPGENLAQAEGNSGPRIINVNVRNDIDLEKFKMKLNEVMQANDFGPVA